MFHTVYTRVHTRSTCTTCTVPVQEYRAGTCGWCVCTVHTPVYGTLHFHVCMYGMLQKNEKEMGGGGGDGGGDV